MYATRHLALVAWLERQGHSASIGRFEGKPCFIFDQLSVVNGNVLRQEYQQTELYALDCRVVTLRDQLREA